MGAGSSRAVAKAPLTVVPPYQQVAVTSATSPRWVLLTEDPRGFLVLPSLLGSTLGQAVGEESVISSGLTSPERAGDPRPPPRLACPGRRPEGRGSSPGAGPGKAGSRRWTWVLGEVCIRDLLLLAGWERVSSTRPAEGIHLCKR